jgi:hypothetical protein
VPRAVLPSVGAGNLWVEEVQVNHSRNRRESLNMFFNLNLAR